jgi:predicted nucleic acid-binding protein
VILADSSAWIEYLRGSGSSQGVRMLELIRNREVVTTEVVVMEILAGAHGGPHAKELAQMLAAFDLLPVGDVATYEAAAGIQRRCRTAGHTIRRALDCLVAAVAIREGVAVLHRDRDFDAIARNTSLQIA